MLRSVHPERDSVAARARGQRLTLPSHESATAAKSWLRGWVSRARPERSLRSVRSAPSIPLMADAFRKLEDLPPLRLTASDLAQIGDELAAQMNSGGKVDVSYEVGFGDGTNFERDSSAGFLSNLDSAGEPLDQVIVNIMAATQRPKSLRAASSWSTTATSSR